MPVEPSVLAAFLAAALVLVISPGPDTILILRYAIGGGPRVGLATVAGVQLGLAVHTAAAVAGLSLLIAASPVALGAVAVAGALYLGWLGMQSLRAGILPIGAAAALQVRPAKACRDAMLTNLLNPKVILLFLALMPQFVRPGGSSVAAQLGFLGIMLILVNSIWQVAIALLAEAIRRWLARPVVQRVISSATGAALLVFAVLMLGQHAL